MASSKGMLGGADAIASAAETIYDWQKAIAAHAASLERMAAKPTFGVDRMADNVPIMF